MDPEARVVVTARDQTAAAFASADRNVRQFARGLSSARAIAGAFGLALSGRVFANWVTSGLRAAEVTGENAAQIKRAQEALEGMKKASDELAASIGVKLQPVFEAVADSLQGWRQAVAPTELEKLQAELRGTYEEAARISAEINRVDSRGVLGQVFFGTAGSGALKQELEAVKSKAGDLLRQIVGLQRAQGPPVFAPNMQRIGDFEDRNKGAKRADFTIDYLDEFEEMTVEARKISEDELLKPFPTSEVQALFEPIKKEGLNFAGFAGRGLHDAFVDAFSGIEVNFKDMLKRMAAEMAVSGIFSGLASLFPGGSFFSNFFGGFRANGGPVSSGKGYIVGERGPEWFMPGTSGSIIPGGDGGGIAIYQTNHFNGGDSEQQAAAIAENNRRLKLEVMAEMRERDRRRR
jgi:hypothetical protein